MRTARSWPVAHSTALGWLLAVAAASALFSTMRAKAEEADPDLQAVQAVCGRCHSTAVFMKEPRSWERWNDVFADMTRRGADGTEEQLARVTTYFLENLTLVNVNSSPADELAWVLGVPDEVAQKIIALRQQRPFANLEQLRAVPGVNAANLDKRKSRIFF